MATLEERLGTLAVRVDHLETWAGPGQAGALAEGQRAMRADLAKIGRTQDRHTRMLADLVSDVSGLKISVSTLERRFGVQETEIATLKSDVATLKADMTEVKDTVREILRRLPAPPTGP